MTPGAQRTKALKTKHEWSAKTPRGRRTSSRAVHSRREEDQSVRRTDSPPRTVGQSEEKAISVAKTRSRDFAKAREPKDISSRRVVEGRRQCRRRENRSDGFFARGPSRASSNLIVLNTSKKEAEFSPWEGIRPGRRGGRRQYGSVSRRQ